MQYWKAIFGTDQYGISGSLDDRYRDTTSKQKIGINCKYDTTYKLKADSFIHWLSKLIVGNLPGGYIQGNPLPLFPLIRSPATGAVWGFRVPAIARTCKPQAHTCLRVEHAYCTFSLYGLHGIVRIYVVTKWRTSITTQAHDRFQISLDIPRPLIN